MENGDLMMQWLTCNDEGIDGDPVILVLLVWVGTPQPKSGEEGAKKVADQPDDDKGCHQADVACKLECVDKASIFSELQRVYVFFCPFYRFLSVNIAAKLGDGTLGTRRPILNS